MGCIHCKIMFHYIVLVDAGVCCNYVCQSYKLIHEKKNSLLIILYNQLHMTIVLLVMKFAQYCLFSCIYGRGKHNDG